MTLEEIEKEIQRCRDKAMSFAVMHGGQYFNATPEREANQRRLTELLGLKKNMEAMR